MPEFEISRYVISCTYRTVARFSLLGMLMLSSACLVLDSPDFSPPPRSAPRLTAVLPVTELIKAQPTRAGFSLPDFSATVISEDAGQRLFSALLIDYGKESIGGAPWLAEQVGPRLDAKTAADGPRDVRINWKPGNQLNTGCHTVTLLVTHETKGGGVDHLCPTDANDFDTLTWVVSLCDDDNGAVECSFDGCAVDGEENFKYCETMGQLPTGFN